MKKLISYTITTLSFLTVLAASQLCLADQKLTSVVVSFSNKATGKQSDITANIDDKHKFSQSAQGHHLKASIQGSLKENSDSYVVDITVAMENTNEQSNINITTSILIRHSELKHPISLANINQYSIELTLR